MNNSVASLLLIKKGSSISVRVSCSLLRQLADALPGQRAFMDLVRSIDQVKRAAMRPHRGQREIIADASPAEDLDSAVDDIGEHGGRDDLNHRDFFLGGFFAQRIDHPSRFEGQEADRKSVVEGKRGG